MKIKIDSFRGYLSPLQKRYFSYSYALSSNFKIRPLISLS
ncbi:hypothetical protein D920_02605 [Enterococcus faecalis 13-SD-W-01]|nr:hypothetical protein D920_02605 [Enterococcus faecalis 13-SD-W-01]